MWSRYDTALTEQLHPDRLEIWHEVHHWPPYILHDLVGFAEPHNFTQISQELNGTRSITGTPHLLPGLGGCADLRTSQLHADQSGALWHEVHHWNPHLLPGLGGFADHLYILLVMQSQLVMLQFKGLLDLYFSQSSNE